MKITAPALRNLSVTVAASAVAATALATAAVPASASALAPQCRNGNVAVILTSPKQAASNVGYTVVVQNKGGRACAIDGYAGLGLLSIGGKPVASSVTDGPTFFAADPGAHRVILLPGGFAKAHIAWGDPGTHSHKASLLTVQIPGDVWHKTILLPDAPADIYRGRLTVTAFAAARNG